MVALKPLYMDKAYREALLPLRVSIGKPFAAHPDDDRTEVITSFCKEAMTKASGMANDAKRYLSDDMLEQLVTVTGHLGSTKTPHACLQYADKLNQAGPCYVSLCCSRTRTLTNKQRHANAQLARSSPTPSS